MADVINITSVGVGMAYECKGLPEPCFLPLVEDDQIEVYMKDNRMCVVSYPSCPSFAPSPEDVSCFKFVADDMWPLCVMMRNVVWGRIFLRI